MSPRDAYRGTYSVPKFDIAIVGCVVSTPIGEAHDVDHDGGDQGTEDGKAVHDGCLAVGGDGGREAERSQDDVDEEPEGRVSRETRLTDDTFGALTSFDGVSYQTG